MQAKRIMANLQVADVDAAKSFYTDYLGPSTEEFNMGWVARYTSPDGDANLQLVTRDARRPKTRSFPFTPTTLTLPTKKLRNSASRSCIR
jgi:catechol 2,3-dioxygenase-like lactoylglutathione lyase family enzyme